MIGLVHHAAMSSTSEKRLRQWNPLSQNKSNPTQVEKLESDSTSRDPTQHQPKQCQKGSEVGKNTEGARPGIQAQRPRTRTARTTRQINGARLFWWLARFWRKCPPFRPIPRPTSKWRGKSMKELFVTHISSNKNVFETYGISLILWTWFSHYLQKCYTYTIILTFCFL